MSAAAPSRTIQPAPRPGWRLSNCAQGGPQSAAGTDCLNRQCIFAECTGQGETADCLLLDPPRRLLVGKGRLPVQYHGMREVTCQRGTLPHSRRIVKSVARAGTFGLIWDAAAPVIGAGQEHVRMALAQMAYLNDAALWQAARATMTAVQQERLEALHDKQQREGLTAGEFRADDAQLVEVDQE